MTVIRLTLEKDEERILRYILDRLNLYLNIEVKVNSHDKFITIDLSSDSRCLFDIVKDIISSVILIFYKFRFLSEGLTAVKKNDLVHSALMGALLSFDEDQEAEIIEKGLESAGAYSIKSIYEFRHSRLRESWQNIISLANKLLSQCSADEDIYDLIFFLLAVDSEVSPRIRIESTDGKILMFSDNIKIPVPALTDNPSNNILIAAVRERPSSIVISDPEYIDTGVIDAIRKLGEGN